MNGVQCFRGVFFLAWQIVTDTQWNTMTLSEFQVLA
jgi:hypothetical protein